ncbi:MAG: protein-export chaperone SecB [Gammaproteobacteria bacterium]|nr:protein-export chaperone SecB [Gammaproteobacteria bacterium]MDA7969680.1 protein-export chaperone SecB [Gammaproteobacteria bacterium]MDA8023899.1 protein-export chaperone SecB [Gammaproteobacteria bacterium]CAJ2376013.1 MAG: Protein-export protein SecB [Arenicellales bacterium IbO2]
MSRQKGGATQDDQKPGQSSPAPGVILRRRYTKDLSFENPGAPASLDAPPGAPAPTVAISVEIGGRRRGDLHEVALSVTATAKSRNEILFIAEVRYAGLFEITGLDAAAREQFIYVEAPRILFPYAERILADAARDGGVPEFGITPPDFAAMYARREKDPVEM